MPKLSVFQSMFAFLYLELIISQKSALYIEYGYGYLNKCKIYAIAFVYQYFFLLHLYLECNSYEQSTPSSIQIQTSALLLWKLRYGRCRGFAWPLVIYYSIVLFSFIAFAYFAMQTLLILSTQCSHITYRIKLLPVRTQQNFFHTKLLVPNKYDEAIIFRNFWIIWKLFFWNFPIFYDF